MRYLLIGGYFFIQAVASFGQTYSTGLVFNDEQYQKAQIQPKVSRKLYEDFPLRASLKKFCPTAGNQLQPNTSPSWATNWSALTILNAKENGWEDQKFITHHTFAPIYNYFHVRQTTDDDCQLGVDLFDALSFLKNQGAKPFADFLEFCPRGIPKEIIAPAPDSARCDFNKLFSIDHPGRFKINRVKKSLSEGLPVVIGMYCPPSFYRAKDFWIPTEFASDEYPGHALCVIGYDDEKYGGAFEIINSWGSRWGNNGFLWIRYDDFIRFTRYGYEIFRLTKTAGAYHYAASMFLETSMGDTLNSSPIEEGKYKINESLTTGDHFRIHLQMESPAYLYIFGKEKDHYVAAFPYQDSISAAVIYANQMVSLPDEAHYIEVNGHAGLDQLNILISKFPIDISALLSDLSKYPGTIKSNLDALLPDKLISPTNINWNKSDIRFKAATPDKRAILVQIIIDHI